MRQHGRALDVVARQRHDGMDEELGLWVEVGPVAKRVDAQLECQRDRAELCII